MTRCYRDNISLKSSVYNQTGQSYVDQLSLHRSMCSHLRRVLLAKSVVDSRNPRFVRALQRRASRPSSRLRFLMDGCPSDETIDRLAYDTERHPCETIRAQCRGRGWLQSDCRCEPTKSCLKSRPKCFDNERSKSSSGGARTCRSVASRRYEDEDYAEEEAASRSYNTPRDQEQEEEDEQTFRKSTERSEEEARYAKFVYDITQEIVQNGLYTDRELKQVFHEHLHRNSKRLSRRKMLYEIYQLKISLNMLDDSEEEDELEAGLVLAERFKSVARAPKPPTPPKVLNDNKIMEKLESFRQQQQQGGRSGGSSPGGRRSVVLVDANAEFLVTERDVLSTLADSRLEPEQIRQIYSNLFRRSKDAASLCEPAQGDGGEADRSGSAYARQRPHGILRKEATDFAPSGSPPPRHRRSYSSKGETSEKEGKQPPEKKVGKEESPSGNKKKKKTTKKRAANKTPVESPVKTPSRKKSTPDSSERRSSNSQQASGEKAESPDRSGARAEEIEEEIEAPPPALDESDHEEKEQSSAKESRADNDEEALSIASEISDINSEDISIGSIASPSRLNADQVSARSRYPSINDYFEIFATRESGKRKLWTISDASSDSTTGASRNAEESPLPRVVAASNRVIKRRTSSGPNRYQDADSWRERLSSDFYVDSPRARRRRRCEAACRDKQANDNCSDDCKFVGTNCATLDCSSNPRSQSRVASSSSSSSASS